MAINKITLLGHLTKEPVVRLLATGVNEASFTVASRRWFGPGALRLHEDLPFVPCSAFGPCASRMKGVKQGAKVVVSGRVRTESWNRNSLCPDRLILVCETVHVLKLPDVEWETENLFE